MKPTLMVTLFFFCLILSGQDYTNIDGQKFRFKKFGTGEITVIFESGMSDSLEAWGSLPDIISESARVFLYDRADIGKSDASRLERTIPNMVKELKSILEQEKVLPPYIFVAHSMGGYIARFYADQFRDEVKGLLLLDPSPEAYWENMSKKQLDEYIKGGTEWYRTRHAPKYAKEWVQFIPNMVYMNDLDIPEDMPVILISASEQKWYKFHKEILNGFKNARHYELVGDHYIHRRHQDLTVKYIKELLSFHHSQ